MSLKRIVVDSDVILDHLYGKASPSVLRRLMRVVFCYTTVFQAAEVFSRARTDEEMQAMHDAMGAMKVLGANARGAVRYAQLLRVARGQDRWRILIAGLCMESGLPLVTGRAREYRIFRGLRVLPARDIRTGATAEEIFDAGQRPALTQAARTGAEH